MATTLIDKINNTDMFFADEKEAVISKLGTLSQDDLDKLEEVIDDYEESSKSITGEYVKKYISELDNISEEYKDKDITNAINKIKSGINKLSSTQSNN